MLGTAQLGQRYGIANRTGQPDATTARAIVAAAWEHGIRGFDTAPDYGDAERVLGVALSAVGGAADARVLTKFAHTDSTDYNGLIRSVEESRERLGVPRLDGVLVRRKLLDAWDAIAPALRVLMHAGTVGRVGVSVYTPEEALRALMVDDVSFVQLPTSIIDRRFLTAGVFDRARALGKGVVVRSVLLQGLCTMAPDVAPHLPGAREALTGIQRASEALGVPPLVLALAYVRERCPDADVLIGAEHPAQVAECATLWGQQTVPCADTIERYVPAGSQDLVDPTRWHAVVR